MKKLNLKDMKVKRMVKKYREVKDELFLECYEQYEGNKELFDKDFDKIVNRMAIEKVYKIKID